MHKKIHQGSSKTLYRSDEDRMLEMSFNDNLRISNNSFIEIPGKGIINNAISSYIMKKLDLIGVHNHFVKKANMRRQIVEFADVYPIQVHIASVACGRYVTDLKMEEGYVFEQPIIDFRFKGKNLSYPIVNETQIISLCWLNEEELKRVKIQAINIYSFLAGLFSTIQVRLIDAKLEFGYVFNGEEFVIMLVDEISPDTCRLWDMESNQKLSYEIAQDDPEKIMPAYQELYRRLIPKSSIVE